jgi:hypothetical protein
MPSIINSDDGVVSGTSGLKTTGGNDGITTFQQNGTEAMRIDSNLDVGVGKTTITAKLDVRRTSGTTEPIGRFEAAIGSYTGTSLIASNTLGPDSAYNLFSCITDSDGDAGGPFTEFSVRGDGLVLMDSGYGSAAAAYGCRAWVNFNGDGTVAIRASGNVSSITDNGTGDYTVNFTTAMPDANYSLSVTPGADTTNGSIGYQNSLTAPSTTACRIATRLLNTTPAPAVDRDLVMASFFR